MWLDRKWHDKFMTPAVIIVSSTYLCNATKHLFCDYSCTWEKWYYQYNQICSRYLRCTAYHPTKFSHCCCLTSFCNNKIDLGAILHFKYFVMWIDSFKWKANKYKVWIENILIDVFVMRITAPNSFFHLVSYVLTEQTSRLRVELIMTHCPTFILTTSFVNNSYE